MIQLAKTNGELSMEIFKKFMITWVVLSIMKSIGTSTPKTNLTWDHQNMLPNCITSLIMSDKPYIKPPTFTRFHETK